MVPRPQGIPKAAFALYLLAGAILVLGAGPLLLYIAFGPEDGNPVGLGMLFFAAFMFAGPVLLIAAGVHVVAVWRGGKPEPHGRGQLGRSADLSKSGGTGGSGGTELNWP